VAALSAVRGGLGVLIAAVGIGAGGCDYFRPATPEPPSTEEPVATDYRTPEATLETIRLALEAKALRGGTTAYSGAFAEEPAAGSPEPGFEHIFYPAELALWRQETGRNDTPDWSQSLETTFYIHLVDLRQEPYVMIWGPDPEHPEDIDNGLVNRRYEVRAYTDETTYTYVARGYAHLTLYQRPRDGNWVITRWEDHPDPEADPQDHEQISLGRRRLEIAP
jgi:hypothetical protein